MLEVKYSPTNLQFPFGDTCKVLRKEIPFKMQELHFQTSVTNQYVSLRRGGGDIMNMWSIVM